VQLKVGFAADQHAPVARLQHLAQSLVAVAAGQEQQHPQQLGGGRDDIRVVVIHADAEVGVVQLWIERECFFKDAADAVSLAGLRPGVRRATRATAGSGPWAAAR
jgi:hypothetical protein